MDHATVYDVNDVSVSQSNIENWQLQNNQLLESMVDYHYYSSYQDAGRGPNHTLELFLLGSCKANCNYCYLKAHPELYPSSIQKSDTLMKNLSYMLDFYKEKKFYCNIDFFSGEWLTTPYAEKVFSMVYDKFKDEEEYKPRRILLADNGKFLLDEKSNNTFFKWKEKLGTIGILLSCSISIDGKYCDEFRTPLTDDDYKKIFDIAKEQEWRCHPMVSSTNISHWKENYIWWQETAPPEISETLMMLEVRDKTWTTDRIKEYIEFLDFEVDYQYKNIFKEDKLRFLKAILRNGFTMKDFVDRPWLRARSYDNIALVFDLNAFLGEEGLNCSLCNQLVVRLGDLSIAPCHRLFYPEFKIGEYVIDEEKNKISGLKATNPQMMLIKTATKKSCMPHCECCNIREFCPGPCLGAAYEASGDLLTPPKEVCNLYRAKIPFLIQKYEKMGIFDEIPNVISNKELEQRFLLRKLTEFRDIISRNKDFEVQK